MLLSRPDFFGGHPQCQPAGAWCRVKAVLSALDGVLAREKEAGVRLGRVKLFVGEYDAAGQLADVIQGDLEDTQRTAAEGNDFWARPSSSS